MSEEAKGLAVLVGPAYSYELQNCPLYFLWYAIKISPLLVNCNMEFF